jgi:uncharacterized membrane protein
MLALQAYRWHIWTFGTDLGTFSQAILDTPGGFRDGPETGTHFRFHWAPLMGTLYPILALTHSALSLEFAQVVLIGLCAFPMYALARAHAGERLAVFCGLLPLFYPPLVAVAFLEFHEIAFYPAIAIALMWAADRERWAWFGVFAALGAIVREEVCITFAFAGAAFAAIALLRRATAGRGLLVFEPRTPRALLAAGAGLAGINLAALAFYFLLVIPHVGVWQPSRFYDYPFARGPLGVVFALIAHPAYLLPMVNPGRIGYLLEAFAPLAFLPLLSPWTLIALPGLAEILLSSDAITWRMGSHYAAIWVPWLLVGTVQALVRFEGRGAVAARSGAQAVAAGCALFFIAFNPLHPLHFLKPIYPHDNVRELAALVPATESLITHDEWFTRLAIDYPHATVFEYTPHAYALYADDYPSAYYRDVEKPALQAELKAGSAREIARRGSVALYRIDPTAEAPPSRLAGPTRR